MSTIFNWTKLHQTQIVNAVTSYPKTRVPTVAVWAALLLPPSPPPPLRRPTGPPRAWWPDPQPIRLMAEYPRHVSSSTDSDTRHDGRNAHRRPAPAGCCFLRPGLGWGPRSFGGSVARDDGGTRMTIKYLLDVGPPIQRHDHQSVHQSNPIRSPNRWTTNPFNETHTNLPPACRSPRGRGRRRQRPPKPPRRVDPKPPKPHATDTTGPASSPGPLPGDRPPRLPPRGAPRRLRSLSSRPWGQSPGVGRPAGGVKWHQSQCQGQRR